MDNDVRTQYNFLYENAQSIIKNEAAISLGLQTEDLRVKMVDHQDVQYWIGCLQQFMKKPQVHNSADGCLENSMHKLFSFGVRETDDQRIFEVNQFILELMRTNEGNQRFYDTINPTIAASWLACMGHEEQLIIDILRERVEVVYSFIRNYDYNIYVNPEEYPKIPVDRARHPLVAPYLYEGNVWKLPTVHDVFSYIYLPSILREDGKIQQMIDAIVEYIMDERYQHLHMGYGLMLVQPNKYYSMGWSVHLDRYFKNRFLHPYGVVWNMELMSHYRKARESEWFKNTLNHLRGFEKEGIFEFPTEYLIEAKSKYYVGGGHMGLGEDRKKKQSRKIESTAWMLRILKNCS